MSGSLKKINNSSEVKTLCAIEAGLKGTNFRVFPKLPLSEVFECAAMPGLTKKLRNTLNKSHFDFVVVSAEQHAEFAVEFDGPHHERYEKTRLADIRKNRICQLAEFPLLRVSDLHLARHEEISVLEFMVSRTVKWRSRGPELVEEVRREIEGMSEHELEAMTQSGVLDPALDPTVLFDQECPFPPSLRVRERIRELGVATFPGPGHRGPWSAILGHSSSYHPQSIHRVSWGFYVGGASAGRLKWRKGRLDAPGVVVVKEGVAELSMSWGLVTEADYDDTEPPIAYYRRTGRMPVSLHDVPGASAPSIAEAVCEYLALKEILATAEDWCSRQADPARREC